MKYRTAAMVVVFIFGSFSAVTQSKATEEKTADAVKPEVVAEASSLLVNGDFEGRDNNGIPEGWTKTENPSRNNINYAIDKEEKHGGSQALRFAAERDSGEFHGVWQKVRVTPGKVYALSMWVRGENLKNLSDGQAVIIGGKFLSADGKPVENGSFGEELRVLQKGGEWIQRLFLKKAPEGATALQIELVTYHGTGTAWFDDVVLKEVN